MLGDFAWDVMIRTNTVLLAGGDTFGEVVLAPGGSAANVAVWAKRCGLDTLFIGKIGNDPFGELAKDNLAEEAVKAHFISSEGHLTAAVGVWIDHTGERSMVSGKGADFYLLPSELPRGLLSNVQHLHLSAWSFFTDPPRAAAREAARYAKKHGAKLSFDPGSFQLISEMGVERFLSYTKDLDIDIIFPNHQEGEVLSGEHEPEAIAKKLQEIYPKALIALKLDAEGAYIYEGDVGHVISPTDDHLLDATGAGDSFAGAFLASYLRYKDAKVAGVFATKISGWVIEHLGARPKGDGRLEQLLKQFH
ncbi:MAG: carbohydrate kinase family protein [Deinococcales bacterium]